MLALGSSQIWIPVGPLMQTPASNKQHMHGPATGLGCLCPRRSTSYLPTVHHLTAIVPSRLGAQKGLASSSSSLHMLAGHNFLTALLTKAA